MFFCWFIAYVLLTICTITTIILSWFQHVTKDIYNCIVFGVNRLHGVIMRNITIISFIIIWNWVIYKVWISQGTIFLFNNIICWGWREVMTAKLLRNGIVFNFNVEVGRWRYLIRIADLECSFFEWILSIGWLILRNF
jgi:hypothetical protein